MGFAIGANQANSQWVDIAQEVTTRNLVNFESASIVGNAAGVGTANLTPLFSVSVDDTGYWAAVNPSYSNTSDGWAHYSRNQISGAVYTYIRTQPFDFVEAGKTYTLLVEVENASDNAIGRNTMLFSTDGQLGSSSWQFSEGVTNIPVRVMAEEATYGLTFRFHQPARVLTEFDIRLSLYDGDYTGEYMPVGYVGLDMGGAIIPIDLQGNTLGEVDSIKDVLEVDADGTVTLNKSDSSTIPLGSVTMPTVTDGTIIKALAENAPDIMAVYERYVVFKGEQPIKRIYKGQELIYPESE
ncbi:MAG: hypothetical protein IJ113_01095 [Eggerthellaceae bacterium]|nr:hypothetical protein [Eggerthellaceae bacterium]